MEASEACRFLDPTTIYLAAAVCTSTLGTLSQPFIPTLHKLISQHTSLLLHSPHAYNYKKLKNILSTIRIKPDVSVIERIGLVSTSTNVGGLVDELFCLCMTSPQCLYLLVELIDTQIDSTNSVYEHDSLIVLFLRKCCVAFHSLCFESLPRLINQLTQFMDSNEQHQKENINNLFTQSSTITVTKKLENLVHKKDVALIYDSLHQYFDRALLQQQHATLSLGAAYAQLNNNRNAKAAFDDTIRCAGVDDIKCRQLALKYLACIENDVGKRVVLLEHAGATHRLKVECLFGCFSTGGFVGRMKMMMPILGRGNNKNNVNNNKRNRGEEEDGQGGVIEKLLLMVCVRKEAGDLQNALRNIKLALKLCKKLNENSKHTKQYIECQTAKSLLLFQLGDPNIAILNLQKCLFSKCAEMTPHLEAAYRTYEYMKMKRALNNCDIRNMSRHTRVLKSISLVTYNIDSYLDCISTLRETAAVFNRPIRSIQGMRDTASKNHDVAAALACIILCKNLGLYNEYVESCIVLCESLIHHHQAKKCLNVIVSNNIFVSCYGCGPSLTARALCTFVEAKLLHHGDGDDHDQLMNKIKEAGKCYEKCEDVMGVARCWYLLCRIYYMRNDVDINIKKRNFAAMKFNCIMKTVRHRQI